MYYIYFPLGSVVTLHLQKKQQATCEAMNSLCIQPQTSFR